MMIVLDIYLIICHVHDKFPFYLLSLLCIPNETYTDTANVNKRPTEEHGSKPSETRASSLGVFDKLTPP